MSRRRCCCTKCYCGETKITADGTVTWISHTVADGVITRVSNESACVTYYVESVSGDSDGGSGTELDPWTSLNQVFDDDCIYAICTHAASPDRCPMVKVLVKGTIDYAVAGNAARNYLKRLVLEPWGEEAFVINVSGTATTRGILTCVGCIWKNATINAVGTTSGSNSGTGEGFYLCTECIFNSIESNGTGAGTSSNGGSGRGFLSCHSSAFDYTTGTGTGDSAETYAGMAFGYDLCDYSTFSNCSGNGTAIGDGFVGSNGCGFRECDSSIFEDCIGEGFGSGAATLNGPVGYGFYGCLSSAFDTCDGSGSASGDTVLHACGFYANTGSSFLSCTTTSRICSGSDCGSFSCDV